MALPGQRRAKARRQANLVLDPGAQLHGPDARSGRTGLVEGVGSDPNDKRSTDELLRICASASGSPVGGSTLSVPNSSRGRYFPPASVGRLLKSSAAPTTSSIGCGASSVRSASFRLLTASIVDANPERELVPRMTRRSGTRYCRKFAKWPPISNEPDDLCGSASDANVPMKKPGNGQCYNDAAHDRPPGAHVIVLRSVAGVRGPHRRRAARSSAMRATRPARCSRRRTG